MITVVEDKTSHSWIYLVLIAAILCTIYAKSWLRAAKLALILPGPPALPLIGNALLIADTKRLVDYGNSAYTQFGPVFRGWLAIVPCFFVVEPKLIQLILGDKRQNDKNFLYSFMHNFIGEGLITNNGHKWKAHRKFIQPCFHIKVLETYIGAFAKSAHTFTDKLKTDCDFNMTPYINECILHVLHQVILGLSSDETAKYLQKHPFRKGESSMVTYRMTHPWLLINSAFQFTKYARMELKQKSKLQNYVKMFLHRKDETCNNEFKSLLDMFLEISDGNPQFTVEDVINETCTFILAGQESVGAAVAFTLYNLAKFTNHQVTARQELDEIFGDSDKPPNLPELKQMHYLEQCIKESMRLYPSIPMFARKLSEDVDIGEHTLPAGCNVIVSPFITHRLAHVYTDPLKFDPTRFTLENFSKLHPFAYFPFSAGPRNCIGYKFALLEIKVIVSSILRKYHIELVPGHEPKLSYRITLRAKGGIWVKLVDRDRKLT